MRRIIGLEHELDAVFYDPSGNLFYEVKPREALLDSFFRVAMRHGVASSPLTFDQGVDRIILPNGGMFYVDLGNPEVCLPECKDPREVVIYDKAADILLTKILDTWRRSSRNPGSAYLRLYKKNTGILPNPDASKEAKRRTPTSRAFHENYLVSQGVFERITVGKSAEKLEGFQREMWFFGLFLMVRYLITGSGGIVCNSNETTRREYPFEFVVSPRFSNIYKIVSSSTTATGCERAVINSKSESLMGNLPYRRLHVICGDGNMMEKSVWLTVGITSLILELLEHDFWDRNLALNPLSVSSNFGDFLKDLSRDHTGETRLELVDGRKNTVLEILWRYYELCESYSLKYKKKRHEKILKEWRRVLRAIETDWRDLIGVLGWPTLRWIVCGEDERRSLDEEEAHRLNFEFHNIHTGEGLYYELLDDFERVTTDEEILAAVSHPPRTRASLRAWLCNHIKRRGFSFSCNWNSVSFCDEDDPEMEYRIRLENPYVVRIRKSQVDESTRVAMIKLGLLDKEEE
ncbi:MAG: proteasome accessory factor PafA2 family protein [Parcubacteria group bacterium]|nr:proteasome accessory factor PafA2 family protein [Parcubacteria group bacterium]